MESTLEIKEFVSLRRQELNNENDELIIKLEICTQSIHRWLQYCQYHYFTLENSIEESDLRMDRISTYRRAGENVSLRYVYEANIAAFLNSLHALLDSFPYLLNLFIPVYSDSESTSVKWHGDFLKKYKDMSFYDDLMEFMLDENFHKVKGYVNTIKHKHLIRILNKWTYLEFESYNFKQPFISETGIVRFKAEESIGQNALSFIQGCHDDLIPKFFSLCNSVLRYKIEEKL